MELKSDSFLWLWTRTGVNCNQVLHLCFVPLLLLHVFRQRFLVNSVRESKDAASTLNLGQQLLHDIVRVKDAQLGDPSWLEEKDRRRNQTKDCDAELSSTYVPGGDEVKEDDGRDHQEEGGYVVGKAEAS